MNTDTEILKQVPRFVETADVGGKRSKIRMTEQGVHSSHMEKRQDFT